jgi:TDG/mug DNA glycosylase family protein
VIFVGTAASKRSAEVGAPYAGPGNAFWDILFQIGLTPRRLDPLEFQEVMSYGIGLTGMVPHKIGNDDILRPEDFDPEGLRAKIAKFKPRVLAFNGKRAAQAFYGHPAIRYGRQPEPVGSTVIFVLPSTSGAARRYWDPSYWFELANFVNSASKDSPANGIMSGDSS